MLIIDKSQDELIDSIVQRTIDMYKKGAIKEVDTFINVQKNIPDHSILPIGFRVIKELIFNLRNLNKETNGLRNIIHLINDSLFDVCKQTRRYSKTQYKYMSKYLVGDNCYWIPAKELERDHIRVEQLDRLMEKYGTPKPVFQFLNCDKNNREYIMDKEQRLKEKIGRCFSRNDIFNLSIPFLNEPFKSKISEIHKKDKLRKKIIIN